MAPLKSKIKLKGRLKRYMQTSLYLGFILAAVNLAVYLLSVPAGVIISCFVLFYFTVVISLQLYNRPVIMNELVSFATQYGQVQKVLLRELRFLMRCWTTRGVLSGQTSLLRRWYIKKRVQEVHYFPFSVHYEGKTAG